MSIKIQINSLEALERLIGTDDEFEIEVRKSVIEAFARGFTKNVANTEAVAAELKKLEANTLEHTRKIIKDEVGLIESRGVWGKNEWKLSPEAEQLIAAKAQLEVRLSLDSAIHKAISEIDIDTRVRNILDGVVEYHVKKVVGESIQAKIMELLNK